MLENTRYKLKTEKRLTVGYFGGSITEGAGASDPSRTSWRGATFDWLKASYPDCELSEVNAAIGGTGSQLGIFRCERDLMSKSPDLVFVEYSVNDFGSDYDSVLVNSETIIRKILTANPFADIIYVHTTTKSISDRLASGGEYTSRSAHSTVMHHYGIDQIDMGEILRAKTLLEGGDWKKYTRDDVHPNDDGYRLYTASVVDYLERTLSGAAPESKAAHSLPAALTDLRMNARLEDAWELLDGTSQGWEKVDSTLCSRYDHYIEASKPGAQLEITFVGRRVGLYLMLAKDSGDLIYSIDGGEDKTLRTWDSYCKSFNRAGGMMLGGELCEGAHKLVLRVADGKADESEGHAIRIGAVMVY